jgi:hypothetical protein
MPALNIELDLELNSDVDKDTVGIATLSSLVPLLSSSYSNVLLGIQLYGPPAAEPYPLYRKPPRRL